MSQKETSSEKLRPNKQGSLKEFFLVLGIIPLIPLLLGIGIISGIWWIICGTWLGFLVRLRWYPQGKYMLFVYSNSPNWKEYIEANILPRISSYAVVINWSERSKWEWEKKPLEFKVFQHWTGVRRYFFKGKKKWDGREFNPIAIIFVPWWRRKVLRFWQAFKDFKHGKKKSLTNLEAQFFEIIKSVK